MVLNRVLLASLLLCFAYNCQSLKETDESVSSTSKVVGNPNDNLRYDYSGTLSVEDMALLREKFEWNLEDVLLINYTLPEENCKITFPKPEDPKARFKRARNWWDSFYSNTQTYDARIVHVEASERYARAFGQYSNQYYPDPDAYLLKNIFRNARGCEAVLAVNKAGQFYQQNETYSREQVAFYVAKLKDALYPE